MISYKEQELLEQICKGSKEALFDIHTMISKVYDDELALDLNQQVSRYQQLQERAFDGLLEQGVIPAPMGILDRTKRWGGIQAATALNVSTGHVADMMLKEHEKRSSQMGKQLGEGKHISSMAYELAEEFADFEKENIRKLKTYL